MKILACTDLHLSSTAIKKIKEKIIKHKPEVVICAGDITVFEEGLDDMLAKLNKLRKKVILIHGNHETDVVMKRLCKKYDNLIFVDKTNYIHHDVIFLGYGGGGFSLTDPDFNKYGTRFAALLKKHPTKKAVFVTHAPPYNTRLDLIIEHHCGNKTLRKFVEKNNISLHICGHLHENFGLSDAIGNTKVLNPGPYGKILTI